MVMKSVIFAGRVININKKTMKKFFTILLLCMTGLVGFSQVITDSVAYLDINQIRALIGSGGMNFYDKANGKAAFEYPAGSGKTTIFCSSLWIGAKSNGLLYLAGERYRSSGVRDFYPGPVMDQTQYATELPQWNRLWKINKSEIDDHIANWNSVGYQVPASIMEWPVNGNVTAGMNPHQAPFADVDSNGIYNPENGDYPAIRGDQAIYFIFNDSVRSHTQTGGRRLAVEVHGMAYAYNTIPELEKAVFINYLFYNRSSRVYDSLYVGNFTDVDLGYYLDDYVGCDSALNTFFVYNAFGFDSVYGNNPPVQTITMMNLPMTSFVYFNNNPGIHPSTSDPTTATEFYSYMKSIWKDGTHFVYGDDGYPDGPQDSVKVKYLFPGYPNDSNQWNEVNAGNMPFDRRGVGISGPYTLMPGDYLSFDLAYITVDSGFAKSGGFPNVDNMLQVVAGFQSFFDTIHPNDGNDIALGIQRNQTPLFSNARVDVYPNPANDLLTISCNQWAKEMTLEISDLSGRIICRMPMKGKHSDIDIKEYLNGIYIIRISSGGISRFAKFVKM